METSDARGGQKGKTVTYNMEETIPPEEEQDGISRISRRTPRIVSGPSVPWRR